MTDGRIYEQVRQPFTEAEMAVMHGELVTAVGEVRQLRADKAQTNATINASIKETESRVFTLQERLANGYQTVEAEIVYIFDEPEPGRKQVAIAATGLVLRTEQMTLAERQRSFGFEKE
jgi:hypothetical protein